MRRDHSFSPKERRRKKSKEETAPEWDGKNPSLEVRKGLTALPSCGTIVKSGHMGDP